MSVGAFYDKLIGIAIGAYAIYMGVKINKTNPDKTIKILKPVKLGKLLIICGVVILIAQLTLFLF